MSRTGTIIVVQGWQGDNDRVNDHVDLYAHHGLPMVSLSPEDAPMTVAGATNIRAGVNAYNGIEAQVDRYTPQFKKLLDCDADWFLINEPDSFCLSPEIPQYLYADQRVVWANYVYPGDYMAHMGETDVDAMLKIHDTAMQAPWFVSKYALEKMMEVNDQVIEELPTYAKYIDWWFHLAPHLAGLQHAPYGTDGISHAWEGPIIEAVSNGAVMIHGVKEPGVLAAVRATYLAR